MVRITSYSELKKAQARRHRGLLLIRYHPAEGAGELVLHEVLGITHDLTLSVLSLWCCSIPKGLLSLPFEEVQDLPLLTRGPMLPQTS